MKKLFILACAALFTFSVSKAQSDCMALFPSNKGAMLINKTYDASNNLLRTMTYTVINSYSNVSGEDIQMGFTLTDNNGNTIDKGTIDARCDDGIFYLKMINRGMAPEVMNILGQDTELVGDFLDYPNTFADEPFDSTFKMDGGEFTIRSKSNKKDWMSVKVSDRQYEKNESITTPAGKFDASKIKFNFETFKDKKTTRYSGVEWYASGAGIVRSETYDSKGKLVNYTELTTLQDK